MQHVKQIRVYPNFDTGMTKINVSYILNGYEICTTTLQNTAENPNRVVTSGLTLDKENLILTVEKIVNVEETATTEEVAPNAQIALDTIAEVANIEEVAEVSETTTAETATPATHEKPIKKYNLGENITLIDSWQNKYIASKFWRLCDNDNFQYTLRLQSDGDLYLTHGNKFYPVENVNKKNEPNHDKTQNYSKLVEIFKDYKQSQVIGNIHYYTDVLKRKNGKLTKTQAEKLAYILKIAKREKYKYGNSFNFENLPSWKLPKVA
ncbi:MAG: hypothetical protein FWG64_03490 [Firmicutes bacterium]|nr:hypothetical protein [Bacillota bacterium]